MFHDLYIFGVIRTITPSRFPISINTIEYMYIGTVYSQVCFKIDITSPPREIRYFVIIRKLGEIFFHDSAHCYSVSRYIHNNYSVVGIVHVPRF